MKTWLLALTVSVLPLADTAHAAKIQLTPHRAIYELSLASTRSGSGIVGARGTMTYSFDDVCDGWAVQNQVNISYNYAEGDSTSSATDFLAWESKPIAGKPIEYSFRLRNSQNGVITENIEGQATMPANGKDSGSLIFKKNNDEEGMELTETTLPAGSIFPTQHTILLLKAAQDKGANFSSIVFDGTEVSKPYLIHTAIGNSITDDKAPLDNPLLKTTHWPVRLAFFPVRGKELTPIYEMSIDYHGNGIAAVITQVFNNFSLRGQLISLEALPDNGC